MATIRQVRLDIRYRELLDYFLQEMDRGQQPWKEGWFCRVPTNLATRRQYRGLNILSLNAAQERRGYSSHYWLTEKQAVRLRGRVKPDQLAHPQYVIMAGWVRSVRRIDSGVLLVEWRLLTRDYAVYNLDQTVGLRHLAEKDTLPLFGPIEQAENIIRWYKDPPAIRPDRFQAYYHPGTDSIGIPPLDQFNCREEYYSTLFHELIHSTGHPKRLRRRSFLETIRFGSEEYAKEELVAEFGAAFLCSRCGFVSQTKKNTAAYLKSWCAVLQNEPTYLCQAASQAQRAVDYILGIEPDATYHYRETEKDITNFDDNGSASVPWE